LHDDTGDRIRTLYKSRQGDGRYGTMIYKQFENRGTD